MAKNLVIWGSCVTRDMWKYYRGNWELKFYVARQSAIANGNKVPLPAVESDIASAFQRKSVEYDFAGRAVDIASTWKADAVVIDLVDERFGVFAMPSGYVTASFELTTSNWNPAKESAAETVPAELAATPEQIFFGTDQHFDLWSAAFTQAIKDLRTKRPTAKLACIRIDFAAADETGADLPLSLGLNAAEWNQLYERYYEVVAGLGIRILEAPKELVAGSSTHEWGPAAFHYVDAVYESIARQLEEFLDAE